MFTQLETLLRGSMDIQNTGFQFSTKVNSSFRNNRFQLQTKNAVIIGHGNVGLDVSRMLLKNIDELASTDITKEALELLKSSQVKNVQLIGRRGVAQASFTTGELREVLSIPYVYDLVL